MIDIIEINPAHGEVTQLLDGRSAFDVSEHSRLRFKRERNKAAKAYRFVLKLTELSQMVDAMFERLDVAVEHRASAATAHPMPDPMDIEPFLGRLLTAANPVAYFCVKNLRAATSDGAQTVFAQKLERVRNRHLENSICEMTNLDRGESFNVQARIESAQTIQQFQIPFLFQGWMQTTDHVHFGDSKWKRVRHCLNNFTRCVLERMGVAFLGSKGAELAR